MIDVTKYIINLLEQQGEVTLPGIGGFYLSHTDTAFIQGTNTFYPAKTEVAFSSFRLADDKRLSGAIELKESLSKGLAEYEVQKFVIRIKQELSRNGQFLLNGLGRLTTDERSTICFESAEDLQFNKANTGLTSFSARTAVPHPDTFAVEKPISRILPILEKKENWKWLLISLGVILVICLVVIIGVQYYMANME